MPTTLPRLSIVVSEEQHSLLTRLGARQGRSAASYVRHLVEIATPSLRAVLEPLEAALAAEQLHEETMGELLDHAQDAMDDQLAMAFGEVAEQAADSPAGERSEPAGEAAPVASGSSRPPYGNTGVKTPRRPSRAKKAVGRGA